MATRDTDPERKIVSVTAKLTAHVLEVGDLVRLDTLRANIDINAEVVAIGPRILSGQGAGRLQLTLETIRDNNAPLVDMPLQTSLVMRKGTGVATFTNASTTRTYIQDGILKYAAVNEPRFEKNGLLMEGPRTNYLTSSSDFVNPGWSKVAGVNVTPSDALAPDGTLSASKVEDLNSTDWSYIQRVGAVVDDTAPRTASLFIEKDDNEARFPLLRLGYYGGDITYGDLSVNTKTGEIFSKHNTIRANISDENPNYWRVEFTVVNNGTGNNGCYLGVFPAASATLGGAYSTTINGSIHAWGSQVEDGDFASSYIPTDTAPATRSQDQLWIPHTDNISETVNGHFSILADVNLLGYDDVAQAVYWVEGEQWRVLYASVAASGSGDEPTMFKQNGFPISGEERIPLHEVHRLAHVFDGTQQQMYLDGRLLISNNNVATTGTPNKISIGCANIGNRELFGHLKNFRIYGEALSPEQMKVS
ncbi:phage head spike fiber domain-containing protein [Solemya velesiana gill symbiont]|uniref:LamG-like jellyroll fold domain-containing protein n=1 Tax=Solemya velesiana gill symbiont TaxID=1918948 RepID=A0A1T2KX71_9GAMM|nr:LamG-like jellyroll fold domain-containing protein [Solemya velesiana gill symbiont]OOZ37445.1 hypothetical protein BOW51_02570 [Solemya velesiana gill symbiont]